ncbi:MAG TPA: hypothetical protein VJN96_27430 [Vicinamibacterales bacterium]|nr:hypothetical protein [Vicinamibacterales bacterium]
MRFTRLLAALTLASVSVLAAARQDPQMQHRGQMVMGFDQSKTTHHFSLYEDGGAIEVSVNDPADTANRDAIRAHLPHIAQMFGAGNFDAPMEVHAQQVPGTAEMAKLKDRLTYKYVETPRGGRVDVVTTDTDALAAVHAFLKFQIGDHHTGDSTRVTRRPKTTEAVR